MKKKSVELTLPKDMSIGLSEAVFRVFDEGSKLGELQVSKGSVTWFSRNGKLGYTMGWDKFDRIMQENGRKTKTR